MPLGMVSAHGIFYLHGMCDYESKAWAPVQRKYSLLCNFSTQFSAKLLFFLACKDCINAFIEDNDL